MHEIWRILLVFPWMRRAGCELLKLKAKDRFFKASTRVRAISDISSSLSFALPLTVF
ncbi:hypothetical protein RSAG8_13275, partial [Rhizoctonia solani AG-8 WAC10335]